MSFLFPSLLWIGLPLIAVPVLIHLINLRRQKRVKWAAMKFLLESQQRYKKWILLKQLLLLAARMAVIALIVMMLANMIVRNEWLRLLGTGTTHHLVLLDDSYSMSDRWDNTSALGEGKRAVQAIVDQASRQSDAQIFTLLTFSEAARLSAGAQPAVFAEGIDSVLRSRLESLLAAVEPSETDVGPGEALKSVRRLPLAADDQTLIVYLVSDFRARQFAVATDERKLLAELGEEAAQLHLVRCVRSERPNLAITGLEPDTGVRAAGVEMWMNVTVANYGDEPARGVVVQIEQDGDALPALAIDKEIGPQDEVTQKFRVQFPRSGAHWLSASLGTDAVATDNRRYFACELPMARPVAVIDGSPDGRGARQLSLALAPGGNTRTGWQPHTEPLDFLLRTEELQQQAAVCLLDVPRLSELELEALEAYVQNGGGVAFFLGPQVDRRYYNEQLYRDGAGLFPVPLKLPTQLLDNPYESTPDLEVTDHPLFRVLSGRRNSLLPLVLVDYYYAVADGWMPDPQSSTRIVAQMRNGAPLVVEERFGRGRVVAQLTKLSSADTALGRWNNWSLTPAFPVLANELISYLAAGESVDNLYTVGEDMTVVATESEYEPIFRFLLPAEGTAVIELPVDATSADGKLTAELEDIAASGIYEVQLQSIEGGAERRAYAFNVPDGEGDLRIVSHEQLTRNFEGIEYQLHDAADMVVDQQHLAGLQMSDALLALLVVLLLGEQLLSFAASFHVSPQAARNL